MTLLKNFYFLLLLAMLGLSSCGDEIEDIDPVTPPIETATTIPQVIVTASLSGTVVDESGMAMNEVLVSVNNNITLTDEYGVFTFSNIEMNQNGTLVSVEKDGYFNNSKNVACKANASSITKLMLIEKVVTTTIGAATGGTATMNGGAKVVIPAEGVQLESGGTYNGNVNVYATWIDPTSNDLNLRMPGDLRGTNTDDETVKLESYGMIGVELEGDSGETLNIADGQTATIEIPVPSSLIGSAPATIPLWHFDEATGYWVEEGVASLTSDNTYVGTVSHFSFWNVDIPHNFVHVEGQIVDSDQNGLRDFLVEITMDSNGEVAYGYTDSNGNFAGYVPKDEALTLSIYQCNEAQEVEIGPYAADAVIETITAINSSTNFLTVFGVLQNCSMELESNGYVIVEAEGSAANFINVDADGNFNGTVGICDVMEVTVSGVSIDPFSQGTSTIQEIPPSNLLDVGTLISCY